MKLRVEDVPSATGITVKLYCTFVLLFFHPILLLCFVSLRSEDIKIRFNRAE